MVKCGQVVKWIKCSGTYTLYYYYYVHYYSNKDNNNNDNKPPLWEIVNWLLYWHFLDFCCLLLQSSVKSDTAMKSQAYGCRAAAYCCKRCNNTKYKDAIMH